MKTPINQTEAKCATGVATGTDSLRPEVISRLIGEANEAEVTIEGTSCTALLDSGSQVSTVSASFHAQHLSNLAIYPLNDLIRVEGVAEQKMPYLGYIEARLTLPELVAPSRSTQDHLFLVVPDTNYHARTPLLIGTNILKPNFSTCKEKHGADFLETKVIQSFPAWEQAFKCMHIASYAAPDCFLGSVKTTKPTVIPANSRVVVSGFCRVQQRIPVLGMVDTSEYSSMPNGLMVLRSAQVINAEAETSARVHVAVRNLTKSNITIPAKAEIGRLERVTVARMDGE